MQLSPAFLALLPVLVDLPLIPRNYKPPRKDRSGNSRRSRAKREAYEVSLVIMRHQREQEQRWREGGPKPKWLRPHASARNWAGQRWSKSAGCWVAAA